MSNDPKSTDVLSNRVSSGGDNGPFPVSLTGQEIKSGKYLGSAQYDAHQTMDTVFLTASGGAPLNAIVTLEQSLTTVYPPTFSLLFLMPAGKVLEQKSFAVQRTFHASEQVTTVRVNDADGWHDIQVEQRSNLVSGWDDATARLGNDMGNARAGGDMGNCRVGNDSGNAGPAK